MIELTDNARRIYTAIRVHYPNATHKMIRDETGLEHAIIYCIVRELIDLKLLDKEVRAKDRKLYFSPINR